MAKPKQNAKLYTHNQIRHTLYPFTNYLLGMESRFLFPDIGNEVFGDKQFFVVTKDYIYCPYVLPNPEHEIAHAVEMANPKRWLLPDWGLAFDPFTNERGLTSRMMFAAMSREVRVRAIELHMMPEYRNDKGSSKYNILRNEHAWGDWAKRYTPFGRFKNYDDVQAWVHDLREKTYRAWSLERIEHEWKIRLGVMREYMDTKAQAA